MIDDLGFYNVGNEKFYDKLPAILRAQQLKVDMEWNFNRYDFSLIDWTFEPETSLDEFYKIRAQQLREAYDYLILFCSGGADSTNMLFAFLNNGIHVDELVASAPISGLRDWKNPHPSNIKVENTIAETFLTQIPFLRTIEQNYPNIKVTLHDYFEDMLNYKVDDWLLKSGDHIHPTMAGRYNLEKYVRLQRLADSGKKIGVIQGIDKPIIVRYQDHLYQVFFDWLYNNKYNSLNHPNCVVEFFYHSPKLPLLAVKQAHVAAKFISMPRNKHIYNMMLLNDERLTGKAPKPDLKTFNTHTYQRGIVPAIYPSIKTDMYQAEKPDRMWMGKHDAWFYDLHKNTRVNQMIMWDLDNLLKSLEKRFLQYCPVRGLLGLKSYRNAYCLGRADKFVPKEILVDNELIIEAPNVIFGDNILSTI
jgi:hypothetical protein